MTLEVYTPEKLDLLAMRFFDLASRIRALAVLTRNKNVNEVPVHDRKALFWCDNLEEWLSKTEMNIEIVLSQLK